MSLGRIVVDLLAKTGSFETDINRSAKLAAKRAKEIDRAFYDAGHSIGGHLRDLTRDLLATVGVTLTVGAAFETLKRGIDIADETRDLSIRLGESTETISAFRYAAQQTGTDMDTLGKGMKILAKNMASALDPTSQQAKIFEALGIKVTDAQGNLKKLGDAIPEIADRFKGLEDGTTKAALAQALFGKSGLELTEFLNQGADGLKTMADRARDLGIIIDNKTAVAADNFNDKLSDLKAATLGLATKVASDLLPELDKLVDWAVDFVKDGKNSAEIAHDIADGFRDMASVANDLKDLIQFLGRVRDILGQIEGVQAELDKNGGDRGFLGNFLAEKFPGLYKPLLGGKHENFSNVTGGGPSFAGVTGTADTISANGPDPRKLGLALAGDHAGKGGKSEAEKQAEQVARAIEQMTKAQKDWEAELSKTGNPVADEFADRLRQISEQAKQFAKEGVPADKIKAFTENMTHLAEQLRDKDLAQAQKEFSDQTAEMAARFKGPAAEALLHFQQEVAKLDQQLKDGAITLDQYNARLDVLAKERDAPGNAVLQDIQQQKDMLGLTAEQQDTYQKLRQAGVSAFNDIGQSIIAANHDLFEHAKAVSDQVRAMDGLRDATAGFFEDLAHGVGVWDALKKAADNFAATLTQIIAQRLAERMFGEAGSASSGSAGGWFSSLLGAIFGGGKAEGGNVFGGTGYLVGEQGPELFVPRTAGVVIPAAQTARMMGRGMTLTQNFYSQERVTQRTAMQARQEAQLLQNRASGRNR